MPRKSPEARAEYQRQYREKNRERLRICKREYYERNLKHEKQRSREWYLAHVEHCARYHRLYARIHQHDIRDYRRRYYQANREYIMRHQRELNKRPGGRRLRTHSAYAMQHPGQYISEALGIELRPYQLAPLGRVLDSIVHHFGDTIILMFPRQSGKDELLLDLLLFLADLYSPMNAGIVMVNPTYKPQTLTAMQRFDASMRASSLTRGEWRSYGGFMRGLGQAHIAFLSGEPQANVTGATASLLLVVNEAQDILPQVYHQKFEPMAASMNGTRILAGTAWTSQTLLAQELRAARQAEKADGRQRVFTVDAEDVRSCAPWYGRHVDGIVQAHGRQHPLVKTQYFNEEIDAQVSMFGPARRALMTGDLFTTKNTKDAKEEYSRNTYAFCIDVAGQDETPSPYGRGIRGGGELRDPKSALSNPRDSTTLSIVEIDLSTLETLQAPTYRVVQRFQWTGLNHLLIFGKLKALADQWRPRHVVIDATGVGEGLWAMLDKALPTRVIPVKFSSEKKSEIGYRFISIIETGRFRDETAFSGQSERSGDPALAGLSAVSRKIGSAPAASHGSSIEDRRSKIVNSPAESVTMSAAANIPSRATVDKEYAACQAEVLPGPRKTMRWGVPDGTRDADGALIHDDIVLADALVAELDALEWSIRFEPFMIPGIDPLEEMSHFRE